MSSSIALVWSNCHVVVRGGGWFRLVGVPVAQSERVAVRLAALGAESVSVVVPGCIQFRCSMASVVGVHQTIIAAFPTCPLAC